MLPSPKSPRPKQLLQLLFDETNDLAARSRPFPSASLSADRNLIPPACVSTFLAMNSGVSKARTRRSRVQLSKALQETLLDAVAGNIGGAHIDVPGDWEDLLTHKVQSFRGATESRLQRAEIPPETRYPCRLGRGDSTRQRAIRHPRRESD